MAELSPLSYILKTQKLKFKATALPMLLVLISFVSTLVLDVQQYPQIEYSKYVSVVGLIWYFVTVRRYRLNRVDPPQQSNALVSPVDGKVVQADKHSIVISKSAYNKADYRYPVDKASLNEQGELWLPAGGLTQPQAKIIYRFETNQPGPQGRLCGIIPGAAKLTIKLPSGYQTQATPGQNLQAGYTVLAIKPEPETPITEQ